MPREGAHLLRAFLLSLRLLSFVVKRSLLLLRFVDPIVSVQRRRRACAVQYRAVCLSTFLQPLYIATSSAVPTNLHRTSSASTRRQNVYPLHNRTPQPNTSPPRPQVPTTSPRRRHRGSLQHEQRNNKARLPTKSLPVAIMLNGTLSTLRTSC